MAIYKPLNRNSRHYILRDGFYKLIKEDLNAGYRKLVEKGKVRPKKGRYGTSINRRDFWKIVRLYLNCVFDEALEKLSGVKWYPGFGKIQMTRIECDKYVPKKRIPGTDIFKPIDLIGNTFTIFRWLRGKKYIAYEIKVGLRLRKKLIHKLFVEKKEYLYLQPNYDKEEEKVRKYYDIPKKNKSLSEVREIQEGLKAM